MVRPIHRDKIGVALKWMGGWIVEVPLPQMKLEMKGGKPPGVPRRRGCRGRRSGASRRTSGSTRVSNRGARLISSLPGKRVAPHPQNSHERKVNHSGRKFLWAVRAANRLILQKSAQRLLNSLPHSVIDDLGLIRFQDRLFPFDHSCLCAWRKYVACWSGLARRSRAIGIPDSAGCGRSPGNLLAVNAPVGLGSLLDHLRPPPVVVSARTGVAVVVQEVRPHGLLHVRARGGSNVLCRHCGSMVPQGNLLDHADGACRRRRRGKKTPRR